MTDGDLSVADLVEYCRTQAGLLAGRSEEIGAEADALLDEIDAEIAEIRSRLAAHAGGEASTDSPPSPGADESDEELAELERLEADIEEKQALAEAERARMAAFQDLSTAYAELAAELEGSDDAGAALERVVEFEADRDAPTYFDERETLLEAVAGSDGAE